MTKKRVRDVLIALVLAGAMAAFGRPAAAQTPAVDLALVLALDCSYSVDSGEYRLQTTGLAGAFLRPEILQAIRRGRHQRIAVSLVQWSGAGKQVVAIPWTVVDDDAGIAHLAARIHRLPRQVPEGGTSITSLLLHAREMLRSLPFHAVRRVIDIAADGRNNAGGKPRPVRDLIAAEGITINGLAILNEVRTLDFYFERNITGGPANFVVVANDYDAFARAIYRKLLKEVEGAGMS